MKDKKIKILLLFIVAITLVFGFSYSFFNYSKKGNENELIVGKIYLHYNTSKSLPLVNVEPRSELDPNMYIEFTIDGLNEYKEKDLWYAIDLLYGDSVQSKNRIRDDLLRFTLMKKVDDGEFETVIENKGYASVNELRMYVETIPKETTTELSHTYRLYVWISDEIKVGNTPNSDYTMEEWNNLFGSIKIRVLGDFLEKSNQSDIRVNFDANGGEVSTPYKYYNYGDTYGELPTPVMHGAVFDGWYDSDGNLVTDVSFVTSNAAYENDVSNYHKEITTEAMYKYIGDRTFSGGNNDYIDTGLYLFKDAENTNKNVYVEFTIKENLGTVNQATIFNSKYEGNNNYPGFVFRRSGSTSSYNISANVNSSNKKAVENMSSFAELKKVRFLRIKDSTNNTNILYYSFNNDAFEPWLDFKNFSLYFNQPATFGAGLQGNGKCQRYFKGTLSNILVEFISDEATLANYENYIHDDFTIPGNSYNSDITLTARWSVNTMNTFPEYITSKKEEIKKIVFKEENDKDLARYNAITDNTLKGDIATNGSVKAWLEKDNSDNLYTLYVESEGKTFLTTGQSLFNGYTNAVEIDLSNVDTSAVTAMNSMFRNCNKLITLDLSNFNTSNVTTMLDMFKGCVNLTSLDLSNFNTSNVTTMLDMFNGCSNLTSLNLSSFNTGNVTTMQGMFNGCSSLISLDLSNFNTSKLTNMQGVFNGCSSLISLDLSNFNTSKVTNMGNMFMNCSSLTSLDVSNFNTSAVTTMQDMFHGCSSLTSLNLSNFDTSKVTKMGYMFYGCSGLTSLDVSNFNTSAVTNMASMFQGCSGLTSLDVSNFNTSAVTNMASMFQGCSGLTSLDVSNFNTSAVTAMNSMFQGCSSLTSLDVSNFNTSAVTTMQSMFSNCSSLTSLDLSSFNTSNVTLMGGNLYYRYGMFAGCKNLKFLNISSFDTSKVTTFEGMFANCENLTNLDLSNFITDNVTSMFGMFSGCKSLTSLDLSGWNVLKVTIFGNGSWSYDGMFDGCKNLVELNLSGWSINSEANLGHMFRGCNKLETIYVSNGFNASNVTGGSNDMFGGCTSLVGQAPNTTYAYSNSNPKDKTYAVIATDTQEGYLTDISLKPSA